MEQSQNQREIYYSPYGYLEIDKSEYDSSNPLIKFTKKNFFTGTIKKTELTKNIEINLKTFYGQRIKYKLIVNINEPLSDLIIHLISAEANQSTTQFNFNQQYRLMHASSTLKQLCLYNNFIEENIHNGDTILLVSPEATKFSSSLKSTHIYLDSKRKIATKMDTDDIEFCLLEPGFQYGKVFLEFMLEAEAIEKNIIIGISTKRTNYMFNKSKGFYGFILSDCQLISNVKENLEKRSYGLQTKIGDKIGMLIELTKNEREVRFFINGVHQGIAFRELPNQTLYPCIGLGFQGTRISVNSKIEFPQVLL